MTKSADPDQLASSEANWSGTTLFAKTGHVMLSKRRVKQGLTNQKKIHLPTGQVNFFFTCPAQIPTCPGFVRLKFLYAQDLQTEIEVPLLTLR